MPVDILDVIVWIVEAWLLIVVVKWGARLLLGAVGLEPHRWLRRLRLLNLLHKKKRDGRQIGRGSVGKPSSTIGFEKRFNPILSLDRDAFVAAMSDIPAKPAETMNFNRGLST
jgi:hypothetical protein